MLPPLHIPRIPLPTIDEFYRDYVYPNKPVVITGMVDDWPALELWSLKYFREKFSEVKVGGIRLKEGEVDVEENRGAPKEKTRFADVLDSVSQGRLDGLALVSLVNSFPDILKNDYRVPAYCKDGRFPVSRLFVGPVGGISPMHQDYPENIYVMVKGIKRITLFHPDAPVYPMRFSRMPNHSAVNIDKPDYKKYPKLRYAQPYVVDLKGGETLFIPSFWWHYVRNIDTCISVNFWWSRGWLIYVSWLAGIYKKWIKK